MPARSKLSAPIIIFGGTFDPVHYGHLRAASEVLAALAPAQLRLLPSGTPPHRTAPQASPQQRVAMLRLVLEQHPDFDLDEREVHRQGPSYMVDTLRSLRSENPTTPLILVLGQDAANQLHRWYRWHELFALAHLVVMTRPETPSHYPAELAEDLAQRHTDARTALHQSLHGRVLHLPVTQLAISSTDIRRQITAQGNPRFLLPEVVRHYIEHQGLYRQPSDTP